MPLLCQPDYAENTCMLVGGDVGVFPAKVRSQVQCFRGGVLQVELLGIGKVVTLTAANLLESAIRAGKIKHHSAAQLPMLPPYNIIGSFLITIFLKSPLVSLPYPFVSLKWMSQ